MAQVESREARERRIIIRAGIFVALGLTIAGVVVFLIGKERNLFQAENTYVAAFENVDGLALDSPVRLGGVTVGRVAEISFGKDLSDRRILVKLELGAHFAERVRRDSVARVSMRGVLGDKAVEISLGSAEEPLVPAGGELQTGSSGDISSVLKATGEVIDNAVSITRNLNVGVAAYTGENIQKDVASIISSARGIMEEIQSGKGAAHALIYDRRTAEEIRELVARAASVAAHLDGAIASVDAVLTDIRTGPGSLHALIYDRKVATAVTDLGDAADAVAKLIQDARTQRDGAIYQLVYGDARTMLTDLGKAASELKAITERINKGEGSVGGLINDPTVYEDLKEVLGSVKRNWILRELVRASISRGERLEGTGKPQNPPPPAGPQAP